MDSSDTIILYFLMSCFSFNDSNSFIKYLHLPPDTINIARFNDLILTNDSFFSNFIENSSFTFYKSIIS